MKVLVVNGSTRINSCSGSIGKVIENFCQVKNIEVNYVDLRNYNLPIFNDSKEQNDLEEIKVLKYYFQQADKFIFVSPEYHAGISGGLKNLIDYLDKAVTYKKCALILSVAGGGKGGLNTLNQLRIILRSLSIHVLSEQFVFDGGMFDSNGQLIGNHKIYSTINSLISELIAFPSLNKKQEMVK